MTDKQIIIDGVDVSGCEYIIPPHKQCPNKPMPYAKETSCFACKEHNTKLNFCKNNPNCYYKQHKRDEQRIVELNKTIKAKEQECEKLETARHLIEISRDNWEYRAKSKERECESLDRWLPIISRLEMAFGSYEKAKAIDFASYTKQIFAELDQLKAENRILKEKFEIAIKNNMDKTLLRLENGDVKEELQEIRDEFGIETLYCHDDNTRVHRCIKLLQLQDCLTEIKEIAEKCCIMQTILDCENYDDCTQCGRISDGEGIQQILQKISEVEE